MVGVPRRVTGLAPTAIPGILSDDAGHDQARKDRVYQQFGVSQRAYLDPRQRHGWWCRIEGVDEDGPTASRHMDRWPELVLRRDELFAG